MADNIFDIIKCQRLYVSGANKIDNATELKEVTESVKVLVASPGSFTIAKAAGGANEVDITITVLDADGSTLTGVRNLELIVSDAATGLGIASTYAIDSITAGTGAIFTALTANKHLIIQTAATGIAVLTVTDATTGAGYIGVVNPINGSPQMLEIEAGDYGS